MRSFIRPQDWPIVTKLIVAFLIVALVPLGLVSLISSTQARDGLLKSAQLNLINASKRTSSAVDAYIRTRLSDVQQMAIDESVIGFLSADRGTLDLRTNRDALATRRLLASRANAIGLNNKPYYFVARVDKDATLNGRIELTSNVEKDQEGAVPPGEPTSVENQPYFLEALTSQFYISDPILSEFSDKNVDAFMYYSTPVYDAKGNKIGVIVSRSSIFPIWQIVNSDADVAGTGSFGMLIDNTNRLGIRIGDSRANKPEKRTEYLYSIMRNLNTAPGATSRTPYVESNRFPDNFNYQAAQKPLPGVYESAQGNYDEANPFFSTTIVDDDARVGYARLSVKPWYYYVVVPQTTYAAAANNIINFIAIVVIVAILLVILLAFVFARLLTIPVRRISRVLTNIGMGDFDARVQVNSADELGRLGESLNAMFDNTLTLIQTREEKEELQDRITTLLNEISTVAEGDLTVQAEVTADITGAIADSFNLMIEELRRVILNIQQSTGQANIYFEQMVYNTQRTDEAADRQAARILNVSSVVSDIDRSIQRVSESTVTSAQVAQEARANAHQGSLAVTKSVASMNRIRGNVQETAKKIKRLGESSQQIGEIVKLIDDIADQTNMLALNAAIQAAMAGEQGKGFSVVAEEVRRLAERSAAATREIATLVKSIQDDTSEAVVAMEESTREVVEGSKVADDAGRALDEIQDVVDKLAQLIVSISEVAQQQAANSTSIAQSMNDISSLTMEATSLRQQSATAVSKLANIVEDLNSSVSTFKVTPEESKPELPSSWSQVVSLENKPFSDNRLHELAFQPDVPNEYQPDVPNEYQPDVPNGYQPNSTYPTWNNVPPTAPAPSVPSVPSGYRPDGYPVAWPDAQEQPQPPSYYPAPPPPPAPVSVGDGRATTNAANVPNGVGVGVTNSGAKAAQSKGENDFDLEAMLAEDADFFESIFGDSGKSNYSGDGRSTRPGGPGKNN